jgi:cytochrome c-type biogenesis protein CcmF
MKFEGEHLLPGQIGHLFVILAFVASLIATYSFFKASFAKDPTESNHWYKFAKISFIVQSISIFIIFGIIYFICSNHYYEYLYAYKHSSKELEPKYLLACIWEGQEGSFYSGVFGIAFWDYLSFSNPSVIHPHHWKNRF